MRPIDADALMKAMYHRAFETDGDTMWQSGCWVRYRAIEQIVKDQPTVAPDHIPDATKMMERKTGKWIVTSEFADCRYAKCNQCKVTQVFYPVNLASDMALADYQARKRTRKELATNEEILRMMDTRDEWNEQWMWGLFAVVLRRRYRFTPAKLVEIFGDIQALHNEIYDDTLDYAEVDKIVKEMVRDEIGMDIDSMNL